jgi:SPP1 gp7 family putative phage head morphogenesis protein
MPVTTDVPGLLTQERLIAERWRGRLGNEMRGIIQHLDREASRSLRVLSPQHVDTYDWAWEARYGERAIEELAELFRLSAAAAAFIEVPLLTANIAANTYAAERAGELIGGITDGTRRNIRRAVTETIEQGRPLRELKNQIREMYDFSESRAESIARTETATAQGQGTRAAALSQGRNEKRWVTAGDNRVDPHCSENASVGWIDAQGVFPTGKDTIPDHPRCRCVVQYRTRRD